MRKKRIIFSILRSILLCLALLGGAGAVHADDAADGRAGLTDYEIYGGQEAYALVPLCSGNASIEPAGSEGEICISRTYRTAGQSWFVKSVGEYVYFQNTSTAKAIEVPGRKAVSGKVLSTSSYAGMNGQLFLLDKMADGTYLIRSKSDANLVMDLDGAKTSYGTAIVLSACEYKGSQRFRLVHVSTAEPAADWGSSRTDAAMQDGDIWNGCIDTLWYYADKKALTYTITSAAELAGAASLVSDGICDFAGKTLLLDKDINLSEIEWMPIGTEDSPFRGSFNGQGHSITCLRITRKNDANGLFGCVDGGCITNFAVKGSVSGNDRNGGVVGYLKAGHVADIYSEVVLAGATDNEEGGICALVSGDGYIEHCTQNAEVRSDNGKAIRAGIAGYSRGGIRYCVNLAAVDTVSEQVGGITGKIAEGAIVEYCANYGVVSGKKWVGGISALADNRALIFGCANYGNVICTGNDGGGVLGERKSDAMVYCSMNTGNVRASKYAGGIVGDGKCSYSFNAGLVEGGSNIGAVSGNASELAWCRALSWTAKKLQGSGDNNGASWLAAGDIISGKCCYELNRKDAAPDLGGYGAGWKTIFYQNISGDPMPSFSGQTVSMSGGKYTNSSYEVKAVYDKNRGTVTGTGAYKAGERVGLMAEPKPGYRFERFEVLSPKAVSQKMSDGTHPYPTGEVTNYENPNITLTDKIGRSYTVNAVFAPDGNPAGDWDFGLAGESSVGNYGEDGAFKVNREFKTPKEAFSYAATQRGNPCIRLKGVWDLDEELVLGSGEVTLDLGGYPIRRDLAGMTKNGGLLRVKKGAVLHIIDSAPEHRTSELFSGGRLEGGRNSSGGGLLHVEGTLTMDGGTLYNGGTSADGGAIHVSGGSIELSGTLISNCFSDTDSSDNNGGAINVVNESKAVLKNCTIRSCIAKEKGGAIHINRENSSLVMEDTVIAACRAENKEGGAIFQDDGMVSLTDCVVNNCRAGDDDAGAIFQNEGPLYCRNTRFENNTAADKGGAIHINTDDQTWLVGCTFAGNQAGDKGGAIFLEDNFLYMEDCHVTGNASANPGGGIYLDDDGSIDMCGVMVIRNNDGKGTMDNLVMEKGAYIYDQGLMRGSDVHVRSTGDGEVALSRRADGILIDEFQVENYFVSDANGLHLDKTEVMESGLTASAFATGTWFILAAGVAALLVFLGAVCITTIKRRKQP